MTHKTKATGGGRQWHNTKLEHIQNTRLSASGQCYQSGSIRCHACNERIFLEYSLRYFSRINAHGANLSGSCSFTAFLRCFFLDEDNFFNDLSVIVDTCNPVRHSSPHHGAGDGYSCSLALRRWRRLISSRIFLGKKPAGLFSGRESLLSVCFSVIHQPLGSMPRRFSSARPNSLSQLARLTPSLLASLSNCSFSSGAIRIWNGGAFPVPFGFLSRLITVDMCTPIALFFCLIGVHPITKAVKKTTPRSAVTHAGRLTKPLTGVTIMAGTQHTPRLAHTHTAFVWRFLALSAGESQIIHVTAWTEREARNRCPSGCVAVFAARIRQGVAHV